MRSARTLAALLLLSIGADAQPARQAGRAARIDPSIVWQPSMSFMREARQCGALQAADHGDCVIEHMTREGAPPPAVNFTRLLKARNDGLVAIAREFRRLGQVDVAYVFYPLRAGQNQGCYLLNGSPDIIDVDDAGLLPKEALKRDATYATLTAQFPDISVWPGDRFGLRFPQLIDRPDSGMRYVVPYILRDGCRARPTVGVAHIAFDFDRQGKFGGTSVVQVVAAGR